MNAKLDLHRRTVLSGAAALALAPAAARAGETDWQALAADVRGEMAWAWRNYAARAWGRDQIKPVSGVGESFFFEDRGPASDLGLTIVEALDTLWLMGLDAEFEDGVRWVKANLRFDVDGSIQIFETNIRLVGGLLSAWGASGDPRLLELAHDLGERLLPGFERSPTGMPYRFVNLKSGAVKDPSSYPAETGSYTPEFGWLGKHTGDARFLKAAKAGVKATLDRRSKIGLLADEIDIETGAWKSRRATIGPPSDSFYEYLWDGWQLFGDPDLKRWYDECTAAIVAHQAELFQGRLWFRQVDFETGAPLDRRQSELAAFYAGLLGQGGDMTRARAYLTSWTAVQERFGVLPESFDYGSFTAVRPTNQLRPELVDSCLALFIVEPDALYRRIARDHYLAMKASSRATYGYTALEDVTATPKRQGDSCPAYWWSEQMKYYWLLFSDTKRFDYRNNYLSTEGNVLVGLKR